MSVHPKSGLRYIMGFRGGRPYGDVVNMYDALGRHHDWIETMSFKQMEENLDAIAADERNFVCLWGVRSPLPPPIRKAKFVQVWSEAFDTNPRKLISAHPGWLRQVQALIPLLDGLFCHTPWMAKMMAVEGVPSLVLPVGWAAETMGEPVFDGFKKHGFMSLAKSVGHHAAKRGWAVPMMKEALGEKFFDGTGLWGRRALSAMNESVGYLYISHSDIQSFSTFRIWQAVATSAALIAEGGRDCWPMEEEDYVPIPTLTKESIPEVCESLLGNSDEFYLDKARGLHEKLRYMTIDHVVDNFLVPASMEIMAR
jgi:hypothetical protein